MIAKTLIEAKIIANLRAKEMGHDLLPFEPCVDRSVSMCKFRTCFCGIIIHPNSPSEFFIEGQALTTVCKSEDDHEPHVKAR